LVSTSGGLLDTNGTALTAQSMLTVTGTLSSVGVFFTAVSATTTTGDLISVGPLGSMTLSGQLLSAFSAGFNVGGNVLSVAGNFTSTGAARLIEFGSTDVVQVTGDLVRIAAGGQATLVDRLLDQDGTL